MACRARTSGGVSYQPGAVVNTSVAPVVTFGPTGVYKLIMLFLLAGAGVVFYRIGKHNLENPIPLEHPLTLQIIMLEMFVFVAAIVLIQITRSITIGRVSAISSDIFGSSSFRIAEIKGCVRASGATPVYYLLNRDNKILWSYSRLARMRVFEGEDELMQWITSFDLLNASDLLIAMKMKFSRRYMAGVLLVFSLPLQLFALEMGLSMLSVK